MGHWSRNSAGRTAIALAALAMMLTTALPAAGVTPAEGGLFWDDDGWTHEPNIEAIAAAGITQGCVAEGTAFCPDLAVTRAQMASFLARALGLSVPTDNRFSDVGEGGVHTGNINAIAEAGITLGCNSDGTLYCPNSFVTRAQMASFLARGLDLAPASGSGFQDLTADFAVHEGNIYAIRDAGITLGCNADGTLYCPQDLVTRGQMASFLTRGLGLTPVAVAPRLFLLDFATCDADNVCDGSGSYPADTPFFIRHGFIFASDDPEYAALQTDPNTGFVLVVDGVELTSTAITSSFTDSVARFDAIDFPSGLSGNVEIEAQWLRLGEVVQDAFVTMTFN